MSKIELSLSKTISKTDKRQKKWTKQRKERGFDDTELWNLDCTLIKFLIPRLKAFKAKLYSFPCQITLEEWEQILDKMIKGFELYKAGVLDKEEVKLVDEALDLFRKYFYDLWN